jgi:hypothetical protein
MYGLIVLPGRGSPKKGLIIRCALVRARPQMLSRRSNLVGGLFEHLPS